MDKEEQKNILQVHDLHLAFGESSILNGVNLKVTPGETVGIIGPNGSGKTTFFNCLSGFHFPQKGSITLHSDDITRLTPGARAKKGLGRVFQNFGVFRDLTVEENIVIAVESKQSPLQTLFPWSTQHKKNLESAKEYLTQVGLESHIGKRAGSLSGGQMRLLEIIRTVAFGADLFLLDEPTAGVSPKMKSDVAAIIKNVMALGKTILIIEHDIRFIEKFCSRIIVLESGKIVLDGPPEQVKADPLLHEIYLGS